MQQASFLTGANATYLSELYGRYCENPGSVDAEWAVFFGSLNDDGQAVLAELRGAPWRHQANRVVGIGFEEEGAKPAKQPGASAEDIRRAALDSIRALMLIRS
jgi:2-oxoglutarate dehydrogenase E1 component